jgi:hypothetical protein
MPDHLPSLGRGIFCVPATAQPEEARNERRTHPGGERCDRLGCVSRLIVPLPAVLRRTLAAFSLSCAVGVSISRAGVIALASEGGPTDVVAHLQVVLDVRASHGPIPV